ncbi:hypothetical protein [Flavobacterium luteum]|uniref:Uncharacterized protein n=1 Tax=Flavobacterium luteum TaxID=2026654 RepID=A0A7J5AEW4_9FLAO|nr:hypothetical protein [Flavobacterium luteum]KAB1156100.1 hypothetical protein F6464_07830 [Flavobacterium luteum]
MLYIFIQTNGLLTAGCWLSDKTYQLSTTNLQLFSKDGLNNNFTGIVPGEILDFCSDNYRN